MRGLLQFQVSFVYVLVFGAWAFPSCLGGHNDHLKEYELAFPIFYTKMIIRASY